jgi:hypothetical protein
MGLDVSIFTVIDVKYLAHASSINQVRYTSIILMTCLIVKNLSQKLTELHLLYNHINDEKVKHLAGALKINQVQESELSLMTLSRGTLLADTYNTGSLAQRDRSCRRQAFI